MYDVCERLRKEFPDIELFVVMHTLGDSSYYTVMERCKDGVDRVTIPRVHELDGRVIERIRYYLGVPLEQRFAEFEKEEARAAEARKQAELDELYERMGGPMWAQLERDGFIQRPKSFAKRNATARRHRAA